MGNSGKSKGKFGKKQQEIQKKAMGNRAKAIIFARNICRRFPSFLIAFAQCSHWFCPNFPLLFPEIRAKAIGNSGKSNGQIWAKAMRKLGKRYFGQKLWKFGVISRIDIIFKIYFLDQIKILKDLASSARNSQYTVEPRYKEVGYNKILL